MKPKMKASNIWILGYLVMLPLIASRSLDLDLSGYDCNDGATKVLTVSSLMSPKDCDTKDFLEDKIFTHRLTNGTRDIHELIKYHYKLIRMEECSVKRNLLEEAIDIALSNPNAFAYNLMKKPGYMGIADGRSIHIYKCHKLNDNDNQDNGYFSALNWDNAESLFYTMSNIGSAFTGIVTIFLIFRLMKNSILFGYRERSIFQGFIYLVKGVPKLPGEFIYILNYDFNTRTNNAILVEP